MDERRDKIREFLGRYFKSRDLGEEEDIFALGFVNSLLALQLVDYVEKEFGVSVDDADLDLDNFRSIARIDAFVARKQEARVGA